MIEDRPAELFGLPGPWRLWIAYGAEDLVALIVEQGVPVRRAGWVPIHPSFLELEEHRAERIRHHAEVFLDHVFRPWRHPEPAWPLFDLFPRFTRVRAWIRDTAHRLAEARSIERPAR